MSETKWTPGPWKAEPGNVGSFHPLFVVAPDRDGFLPWTDDDAHLIAAAKDLYRALEAIAELDQPFVWQHPEEFEEAHAALAKARGEIPMKVYTIFVRVRCTHPNWQPNLVARYIDSQWVEEHSAVERKKELESSFSAFGCFSNDHGATALIVSGSLVDARLVVVEDQDEGDDDDLPAPAENASRPSSSK